MTNPFLAFWCIFAIANLKVKHTQRWKDFLQSIEAHFSDSRWLSMAELWKQGCPNGDSVLQEYSKACRGVSKPHDTRQSGSWPSVLILIFYSHVNELLVAPVCVLFPTLPAGMRQRGGSWNVTIYYLHCLDLLLSPLTMTSNLNNCKGSFTGTCTTFPVAAKAVLCHHGVQA